jgi:hypothetical protein
MGARGIKPNPAVAFRELYKSAARLREASSTDKQRSIVDALIAGLRQIEPAWGVMRLPNGELDLLATHHYNAVQSTANEVG